MNKTLIAAVLATLLAAPTLASAAGNLIDNGSFEDVSFSAGEQNQGAGSWSIYTQIPGWTTVQGDGIEVRNNVAGVAVDGTSFVELDAVGNSTMRQELTTTTAGQWYDLGFMYSPRAGVTGLNNNDIRVVWNGTDVTTVGGNLPAGNLVWTPYSFKVQAIGNDVLTFAAAGQSDALGGSLDAVSLTAAVPEPTTYALMMAGLLAVGFIARRRA